jgi:hypothetical protein
MTSAVSELPVLARQDERCVGGMRGVGRGAWRGSSKLAVWASQDKDKNGGHMGGEEQHQTPVNPRAMLTKGARTSLDGEV